MSEARAKAPPASWRGRGPRRLTSAIGLMLLKRAYARAYLEDRKQVAEGGEQGVEDVREGNECDDEGPRFRNYHVS